jgi:hypothetical protein
MIIPSRPITTLSPIILAGHHIRPEPHLNVEQAKALIAALRQFIKETIE